LREIKNTPQEDPRLEVPDIFLDETIHCLLECVQGMKAELVINLNEIGMSEWEDWNDKKVIVAKRWAIRRYIITQTSQDSEPIHKRLMRHSIRMGIDSVLRQRSKAYVNSTLLLEYINNIFVHYLDELRETKQFEACEAMLLMDNCSSHISDDVIAIFIRERVRIVTFATYTTHIF
jgi:hypothetical protein